MRSAPTSGTAAGARRHVTYANVMSTAAVVLLLVGGGTAVASNVAKAAAKNTVTSKSIKDSTIQSKDLKDGAAVGSADVIDGSLTGGDIDESTFSTKPSGAAGGSLSGTYPNPTLAAGSVTSSTLGTITKVNALLTAVAPGATAEVDATCPAGRTAIGGGAVTTAVQMPIFESTKVDNAQAWRVAVHNPSGSETGYLIVNVLCLAA